MGAPGRLPTGKTNAVIGQQPCACTNRVVHGMKSPAYTNFNDFEKAFLLCRQGNRVAFDETLLNSR